MEQTRTGALVAAGGFAALIASRASGEWQSIQRLPDLGAEVLDPSFAEVRLALAAERLATGFTWVEGPVWFGDSRVLLFSDVPNSRLLRWDEETDQVGIFRRPSNYSNGNTRGRQGPLLTCEHQTRRVSRTEARQAPGDARVPVRGQTAQPGQ